MIYIPALSKLLATKPQISKKVHQTCQCLKFCNVWKDRLRCAPSQQKAEQICPEPRWPRARAHMCCLWWTYWQSSQLQGRGNGGWAAPGGSGWAVRWLGGQTCCQSSSATSQCEPRCWNPVTLQGGAIKEPAERLQSGLELVFPMFPVLPPRWNM